MWSQWWTEKFLKIVQQYSKVLEKFHLVILKLLDVIDMLQSFLVVTQLLASAIFCTRAKK